MRKSPRTTHRGTAPTTGQHQPRDDTARILKCGLLVGYLDYSELSNIPTAKEYVLSSRDCISVLLGELYIDATRVPLLTPYRRSPSQLYFPSFWFPETFLFFSSITFPLIFIPFPYPSHDSFKSIRTHTHIRTHMCPHNRTSEYPLRRCSIFKFHLPDVNNIYFQTVISFKLF